MTAMLKSMTGSGRCEITTNEYKISVEMKAVNHRYLDLSIKMPRKFNCFEADIRSLLKQDISRGKVDLFIAYEDYTQERMSLKYNRALAGEYLAYFKQMSEEFGIANDVGVSSLARFPEIFLMEQQPEDEEHMWQILEHAIREAAGRFVESRVREGESLKEDLLAKLDYMDSLVAQIEKRAPEILEEYRNRLLDKVRELLENASVEDGRIAAEVTIFADKVCTDEETVRLKSHIEATRAELLAGGNVGRKLDFIAQEMNREANTILSKANDLEVSNCAIALKTEIEKVREQIQNIE